MIIELVTGNAHGDEIEQRILRPLGLRRTRVPGTQTSIPGPHPHGYLKRTSEDGTETVDGTRRTPAPGAVQP